jgi:hypothetical protein
MKWLRDNYYEVWNYQTCYAPIFVTRYDGWMRIRFFGLLLVKIKLP